MKNLQGKTAVITGAGSGIGRSLAIKLAQKGCQLAISDINEKTLAETVKEVEKIGGKVFARTLDVADKKAMEKYPAEVVEKWKHIDIVINNAGVALQGTVEETTIEDYEWLMGINFWGVVYGTKFFLPYLKKVDEAHIVNISSVFGLIGVPTQSAYNAAKFAVRGFTEALKHELKGTSISATSVHPGGIKTNIVKSMRFRSDFNGADHATMVDKFNQMAQTTPDSAADTIINGILKKEDRVLIGMDALAIDLLQRTLPENYGFVFGLLK